MEYQKDFFKNSESGKNMWIKYNCVDLVIGEMKAQIERGENPSFLLAIEVVKNNQTAKEINHNLLPTITKKES